MLANTTLSFIVRITIANGKQSPHETQRGDGRNPVSYFLALLDFGQLLS